MIDALRALWIGDRDAALQAARRHDSLLGTALTRHLSTGAHGGTVYDQPAAFQAFISGGGNVGLYEATARALADSHAGVERPAILDIGCGDGAALVPALTRGHVQPARVDLVEVSKALLDTAVHRLEEIGVVATAHPQTAQDFTAALTPDRHWDLAESTFALHTLPPAERSAALTRLRAHADRIVIVEFDVPGHQPGSDEHLRFLADTYEQGLSEYADDRDLIAGGFLMPVLEGQLTPGANRVTYEQPAAAWTAQLEECGWTDVRRTDIYPYWSSPAFMLLARGGA